jgi:hypothetical protein
MNCKGKGEPATEAKGSQVAELFLDIRPGLSVTERGAEKNGHFAKRTPLVFAKRTQMGSFLRSRAKWVRF